MMTLLVSLAVLVQPEPAETRFQEYVSEVRGFSVRLPGEPVESPIASDDGGPPSYRLMLDGYDGAYLVFFEDRPDLAGKSHRARRGELVRAVGELAEMVDGQVTETSVLELDGTHQNQQGLACDIELADPPGLFRSRLYLVGERFFRLTAVGDLEFALSESVEIFLSSFQVTSR